MGKEGKRMAQNPQTLKRKKAFKDAGLEEWSWLFPARKDTNSRRKANNICYNNYNEGCKNINFFKWSFDLNYYFAHKYNYRVTECKWDKKRIYSLWLK